jgi:hypothetical protein
VPETYEKGWKTNMEEIRQGIEGKKTDEIKKWQLNKLLFES